jgi:CHAD domain-containing protein
MRRTRAILNAVAKNGKSPSRPKSPAVLLRGNTLQHLASAFKKQWRRYRKALKSCQERFSSEAVHVSRVETRRLLAIIGLLSPFLLHQRAQKLQTLLKHHLDTFDELRDTQVQLQSLNKLKSRFSAAPPFCDYLRKREKRFAQQTRKNIKDFKTKRIAKIVAAGRVELKRWRKKGATDAANTLLSRALSASFARTQVLREQIVPENPRTIHCTRIAFKRFRYMVEILAAQLPQVDKEKLRAMHGYQTMMGDVQDAVVLLETWKQHASEHEIKSESAQAFEAELQRRLQRFIVTYLASASQLLEFWPQQPLLPPHPRRGMSVSRVSSKRAEALH